MKHVSILMLICVSIVCCKSPDDTPVPAPGPTPAPPFFSDNFNGPGLDTNWYILQDTTASLKLDSGELLISKKSPGGGDKALIYLKAGGYNKLSFTTSVDFRNVYDSAGVTTWVMLTTDPNYTSYNGLPNIYVIISGNSSGSGMQILVNGNGTSAPIKPILANVWHTAIVSYKNEKVTVTVQTKAGEVLGTYTLDYKVVIAGAWGLSGGAYSGFPKAINKPVHFDNFVIK